MRPDLELILIGLVAVKLRARQMIQPGLDASIAR
jgi:hypothetical protein